MTQVKNFSKKKKCLYNIHVSLQIYAKTRREPRNAREPCPDSEILSRKEKKKQFPENLLRACTFRSLEQQPPTRLRVNGILRTNARGLIQLAVGPVIIRVEFVFAFGAVFGDGLKGSLNVI